MSRVRAIATDAQLAQLVLDTPDLIGKIAVDCVVSSPALQRLSVAEQQDAVQDMVAVMHRALTLVAKGVL